MQINEEAIAIILAKRSRKGEGTHPTSFFFFFDFFLMFYFIFERERERERDRQNVSRGGAERETQNLKQAPGSELSAHSLTWGSNPQTTRS